MLPRVLHNHICHINAARCTRKGDFNAVAWELTEVIYEVSYVLMGGFYFALTSWSLDLLPL